jgi:DNA polymerase-3 subunit alpha
MINYGKIVLPFNIIKGISSVNARKIIEIRTSKFNDIYDFFVKSNDILSKNIIVSLIDSGSLDSFNYNRKTLIDNMDSLLNYANLVHDLGNDFVLKPEINIIDEYPKEELIQKEKELFGFYLSSHPVTYYRSKLNDVISLENIQKYFNKYIKIVLLIDRIKEITTKNGDKMAFYSCSDEEKSIDVIVFPKVYNNLSNIKKGDIIIIDGKIERKSDYQIIANNIVKVEEL